MQGRKWYSSSRHFQRHYVTAEVKAQASSSRQPYPSEWYSGLGGGAGSESSGWVGTDWVRGSLKERAHAPYAPFAFDMQGCTVIQTPVAIAARNVTPLTHWRRPGGARQLPAFSRALPRLPGSRAGSVQKGCPYVGKSGDVAGFVMML